MSVWKSGDAAQAGTFPYSPRIRLPGEHPSFKFSGNVSSSPLMHGILSLSIEETL